jgi:hypothetical protein
MMLRDHGEPLVQQEFETVVISTHDEAAAPQIRAPMADGVDEPDQLPLIRGERAVAWRDLPAEECERVFLLQ